jgi:hypothetical protein
MMRAHKYSNSGTSMTRCFETVKEVKPFVELDAELIEIVKVDESINGLADTLVTKNSDNKNLYEIFKDPVELKLHEQLSQKSNQIIKNNILTEPVTVVKPIVESEEEIELEEEEESFDIIDTITDTIGSIVNPGNDDNHLWNVIFGNRNDEKPEVKEKQSKDKKAKGKQVKKSKGNNSSLSSLLKKAPPELLLYYFITLVLDSVETIPSWAVGGILTLAITIAFFAVRVERNNLREKIEIEIERNRKLEDEMVKLKFLVKYNSKSGNLNELLAK